MVGHHKLVMIHCFFLVQFTSLVAEALPLARLGRSGARGAPLGQLGGFGAAGGAKGRSGASAASAVAGPEISPGVARADARN